MNISKNSFKNEMIKLIKKFFENETVKYIVGSIFTFFLLRLFQTNYLDQIIMLLTLLGLIINNLGENSCLFKIRTYFSEMLLYFVKGVSYVFKYLASMLITGAVILLVCGYLNLDPRLANVTNMMSNDKGILVSFVIVVGILISLWIISHYIDKYINEPENLQKKYNIVYYSLLFITYLINFIFKLP